MNSRVAGEQLVKTNQQRFIALHPSALFWGSEVYIRSSFQNALRITGRGEFRVPGFCCRKTHRSKFCDNSGLNRFLILVRSFGTLERVTHIRKTLQNHMLHEEMVAAHLSCQFFVVGSISTCFVKPWGL